MTIEQIMNKQVANLAVLFTKIHHYHWYVNGPSFFAYHEKFEKLYDEVNVLYDDVAERMLSLNLKPATTLKNYLDMTSLSEATEAEGTVEGMIKTLVKDLKHLVIEFRQVIELADQNNDVATTDLFTVAIRSFEKHIWMFSALLADCGCSK